VELRTKPAAEGKLVQRAVIGVFGNKQHGKNTVGHLLEWNFRRMQKRTMQFALADSLKEAAIHLLGMPREVAFGDGISTEEREKLRTEWVRYGRNGREWLQWVGTELGREQIDSGLWIDRAVDKVAADGQGTHFFIITDCRFHNERESLTNRLGGVFIPFIKILVRRPSVPVDLAHPSESEVAEMTNDMFDHVILNEGTMEHLEATVQTLVEELIGVEA
jgi:hypothetical protein